MAKFEGDGGSVKFLDTKGLNDSFLERNFPEYYKKMKLCIDDITIPLSERIWLFQNGYSSRLKCDNDECDNDVKFTKFYKGYNKYCSKKCAAYVTSKDDVVKEKRVKGLRNANNDPIIRREMSEKMSFTKSNFTKGKNDEINNKRRKTCLKIYGIDSVSKRKRVLKKKCGKRKEKLVKDVMSRGYKYIDSDKYNLKLKCDICTCNKDYFEIDRGLFFRRDLKNIEPCINKLPYRSSISSYELKIRDFLDVLNIDYITTDKTILKPKHLDIYIPSSNLGIEFNGLIWHSDKFLSDDYHLNKTNGCLDKKVQLIHIFEDEWLFKQDIVKSRIKNLLGHSERIFARKCIIKEVNDNKLIREFLDVNHIQGFVGSKIKLGLYYDNELVSLMTFGSLRKSMGQTYKKGSFELLRFCNKLNTNVVGGASKLFKYFTRNYEYNEIISYADRRWSKGNMYEKLGFEYVHISKPNYYYITDEIKFKRLNRWKYRKDILVKEGYDKELSERQIMSNRGYNRIYDSGNMKFVYMK